jgi:hypothetical protein
MDDERMDGNIYLFCLDGWTGRMTGWTTGRIQGKLHFSSRRPLQYMIALVDVHDDKEIV